MSITIKVDTRAFNRTFKEYMKLTKRSLVESCNQHAYYMARDAVLTTKAATKDEIAESLNKPSTKYPEVQLAAILVNAERGKQGKKGLTGEKMKSAVEKFIRKRQSHRNFLRSGWIPSIKKLAQLVPKKNGTPIPSGTVKKGRNYGGTTPARDSMFSWRVFTTIWNSATGKVDHQGRAIRYLQTGAKEAIEMERLSMVKYIQRKIAEANKRFENNHG